MSDQESTTTATSTPTSHLFPFTSTLEGPINSKEYFQFESTTSLEHKHKTIETFETKLMGRQLFGYKVELPENVNGITAVFLHYRLKRF